MLLQIAFDPTPVPGWHPSEGLENTVLRSIAITWLDLIIAALLISYALRGRAPNEQEFLGRGHTGNSHGKVQPLLCE